MTLDPNTLKNDLATLSRLIESGALNSTSVEVIKQKLAGEASTLLTTGQIENGIKSLTTQVNHPGLAELANGDGLAKLTENVPGFENDLKTDVSSTEGDLSTMTGETVTTGFRKLYYGGTSVESSNAMLQDATGKDFDALKTVLEGLSTGDFKSLVTDAITSTLMDKLRPAIAQLQNLINTFIPVITGMPLQDIVDKSDGSIGFQIDQLAEGRLGTDEINLVITYISQKRYKDAVEMIARVSTKSRAFIESSVYNMSTQLSDRLRVPNDGSALAPLQVGTSRAGFDDPTDPNSKFSIIHSYDELEADMRSASREITEYVLHWSESATNQFLTAEDLNDIQDGIRYHYVILKNGQIQKGLPINTPGVHIPTAVVANTVTQNNPDALAFQGEAQAVNGEKDATAGGRSADHNKYSIGVCIIGGIAAPAGAPEYERFLSKNSITDAQWKTIDGMFDTFFKVFPGGQVFGHNNIEPNEPDPGFDVQSYVAKRLEKQNTSPNALNAEQLNKSADQEIDNSSVVSAAPDTGATLTSRVGMDSNDTSRIPKQNIVNAIDAAVAQLGPRYKARITPKGGKFRRTTGTQNHPSGDAADHYLTVDGVRVNPNQNRQLYRDYITILVRNAKAKGIRPGIGGYAAFIHYDESPWRQGLANSAGTWGSGTHFAKFV